MSIACPNAIDIYIMVYLKLFLLALPPTVDPTVDLRREHASAAVLGEELTISPIINLGVPEATITWSHDPPLDSRATVGMNGMLTVRDVMSSDRGTYTVTAMNTEGSYVGMDSGSVDIFMNCEDFTNN